MDRSDRPSTPSKYCKYCKYGMNFHFIASPAGRSCGSPAPARQCARPDLRPDLGHRAWAGRERVNHAGRQGLHRYGRSRTEGGTSPPSRRPPIGLTCNCALRPSWPTPSSSPGTSCASYAAVPGAPRQLAKPPRPAGLRNRRMKRLSTWPDRTADVADDGHTPRIIIQAAQRLAPQP